MTLMRGRAPERGEAGFTLVEMLVAMSIFSVILAVFAAAVTDWTKDVVRTTRVSDQTTTSRVVFDLFDKQVPSAVAINRPVKVGTAWYLEFRTDATTPSTCTQWRLDAATRKLQWRTWPTDTGATAATPAWRTVATGLVDTTTQVPAVLPFQLLTPDATYSAQRLEIDLSMRSGTGPVTQTKAVFTARNTSTKTVTNKDDDGDDVSDTQVCQDISGVRS